jgi:hypothetical protein
VLTRLLAGHAVNQHQPVDRVAVGAADKTVKMIGKDRQARRVIVVERADNFAIDQWLADQICEQYLCVIATIFVVFSVKVVFEIRAVGEVAGAFVGLARYLSHPRKTDLRLKLLGLGCVLRQAP